MLNLLEFIKKLNTPYAYGVYCIIFGLGFFLLPERIMSSVISIVGVLFILVGLAKLIITLSKREKDPFRSFKIVKDGAVVFVGVMLVSLRASLSETICSVVGIYLIVVSIITIYKMTKVEKAARGASYALDGVIIALILAFGIWLCVSPTRPNLLLGIALILAGVRLVRSNKKAKRRASERLSYYSRGGDLYSDDFVDKSN